MKRKTIRFDEDLMKWTKELMESNLDLNRTHLSQRICEKMNWISSSGRLREADCRKEMLRLERESIMTFPDSLRKSNPNKTGGFIDNNLSFPEASCSLRELGNIEFVLVSKGSESAKIWRTMMKRFHYLDEICLYGKQLRYLIFSPVYGWVGGLSFSSPAWSTDCRDTFIGWTKEDREKHLQYIVCNSRFLILPSVKVKHLASHVLGKIAKVLPSDWEKRYGIKPLLLETFVDTSLFKGTCYKASNWIKVGATKGRGRNDIKNEYKKTIKDVYIYPLDSDWQRNLCLSTRTSKGAQEQKPKSKNQMTRFEWIGKEMSSLLLGDKRLDRRTLLTMESRYANLGASVPEASKGNPAEAKATYRLLDNKKVKMDKILSPHYESTTKRFEEHQVILAPQDTTELDYSTRPATDGVGPIGKYHKGLLVHDTMAFTEEGTPLGLIDVQVWQRKEEDIGKYRNRKTIPIQVKESNKWLISYQSCEEIQQKYPDKMLVSIGDREADIYELFAEKFSINAMTEILVRSEKSRFRRSTEGYVWDTLQKEQERCRMKVTIPRSGNRKERKATVSVKMKKVTLIPPVKKSKLPKLQVTCIYLKEIDYDETKVDNPLEWMLYTTVEVTDDDMMLKVIDWYSKRWCIEIYHKVLKSGCKIEERQFGNSDRIQNCLAIDLIMAWRVFYLTKLGREVPNLPCDVFFDEYEWKALEFYHNKKEPPETPPTLQKAILMVGKLGGHLGRKGDGMPGIKYMWTGLQKLDLIKEVWLDMKRLIKNEIVRGV